MLFHELIGHRDIASGLIRSRREGRLPHALLFLGPAGNGGLPLALAMAQYVNCEQPTGEDSCGACSSCRKAAQGIHPDLHYSYPFITVASGSKAQQKRKAADYLVEWRRFIREQPYGSYDDWIALLDEESTDGTGNKQGNIPKDEVLDIQRKLHLKTFENGMKVLVLWLPEYLGQEGNRLLKLIEEPPEKTLFILVAESSDRILPTILSRTQIVRVPRFPDAVIRKALQEQKGLDDRAAHELAVSAEGNFRDALFASEGSGTENETLFHEWMTYCSRWQVIRLNSWLENFSRLPREKQIACCQYGLHIVRQCYLESLGAGSASNADAPSENRAVLLPPEGWEQLAADLEKCAGYLNRNAHSRLVMMNASLRFSRAIQEFQMQQAGHTITKKT